MTDHKFFNAFNLMPNIGPVKFQKLLEFFCADLSAAWTANSQQLGAAGLAEKDVEKILAARQVIDPDAELEQLTQQGIKLISILDESYPAPLSQIYAAPAVLYYRGNLQAIDYQCLAVVGARKNTSYGKMAADKIIPPLAAAGITIVSGLALGIDAIAHESTLNSGGLTVAVLGSDLTWENIGPKANFRLAERILENGGCLISDYPLGTQAGKSTFPQRNRIISGLSAGTLVIEAGENSGSLITAGFALEHSRDLFAIPGSIFSSASTGCNQLLKKGAKAVRNASDILEELGWLAAISPAKNDTNSLSADEKLILSCLSEEPINIDKLSFMCHLGVSALSSILMQMELNGLIYSSGGGNYLKK